MHRAHRRCGKCDSQGDNLILEWGASVSKVQSMSSKIQPRRQAESERRGSGDFAAPAVRLGWGDWDFSSYFQANMIHFDRTMYIMSLISLHFLLLYPRCFRPSWHKEKVKEEPSSHMHIPNVRLCMPLEYTQFWHVNVISPVKLLRVGCEREAWWRRRAISKHHVPTSFYWSQNKSIWKSTKDTSTGSWSKIKVLGTGCTRGARAQGTT